MDQVEELYNEIKGNGVASEKSNASVDQLYNEIKGNSQSATETAIPRITVNAKPLVPNSPDIPDEEQSKINQQYKNEGGLGSYISKTLPAEYKKSLNENFTGSREMATIGLSDITQGNVATGAGKVIMGGLGMAAAPISGAVDVVGNEAGKAVGSKEFGEKVKLLPTTGLPIGVAGKTINAMRPTNKAVQDLIETIGPANLPEVISRLKENPRLSVMDVVNPVQQMGQKLVVTEGPHQSIMHDAIKDRISQARGVTENVVNNTMGAPVNVYNKLEEMKKAARDVGQKVINPALENAKPVDIASVIKHIDDKAKPGVNAVITAGEQLPSGPIVNRLNEVRQYLTDDKSIMTDPKRLHEIQSALRAEGQDLLQSATGSDRKLGREVMNLRQKIVDAIDEASGPQDAVTKLGPYKTGLKGYRDEKQIHEAFDKGTEILRNRGSKYDDLPEFWQNWISNATDSEKAAAREGARTAYRQQVSSLKNAATKAETIPEIEFNKEKLKMLFGDKEVEKMARALRDERDIAITNQKLFDNSQTAMRLKANTKVDLPEHSPFGQKLVLPVAAEIAGSFAGAPGVGTAAYWGSAAAKYGFDKAKRKLAMNKNTELTKLLTATGPERDQLLQILSDAIPKPKQSLLSRGTNALQSVIAP